MTRLEALEFLAAAISNGDWGVEASKAARISSPDMNDTMWDAYCGSLDAAKALHDAVLPDWRWEVGTNNLHMGPIGSVWNGRRTFTACASAPARALLIAILKALIAEERDK